MVKTKIIQPAQGAHAYPLLIKSLLLSGGRSHPEREIVYADKLRYDYRTLKQRIHRLANMLTAAGVMPGDTVALLDWDSHRALECFFAVPMIGAVLHTVNVRFSADQIAYTMNHAEDNLVLVHDDFLPVVESLAETLTTVRGYIQLSDEESKATSLPVLGEYETLLAAAGELFDFPDFDENSIATLFYTTGTTGNPKGVVYHHRGAHLNAVNNALSWELPKHPVYLWTLPMFHCNGWCFPWTLAATAGVSVCLRHVQAAAIYGALREHKVSHFCAAPIVLNMLNNADPALKQGLDHPVKAMTAGAAPPATVIAGMEAMGIAVTHVYGLTKTYGPCVVCEPQRRWQGQDATTLSRLKARQGVASPLQGEMRVINPVSGEPVPMDGKTLGEIVLRGNIVMKGYLKNPSASEEAMAQGWFRSGDLAVWHPDGYVEIKDRSKDIIISGGENISSLEVEDVLYRHPDVEEAAVIAMPDETWGEVPCAFVKLKEGRELTQAELIAFCREQMAHFKAPKHIIFTPLPKTSTGKVQKFMLRKQLA